MKFITASVATLVLAAVTSAQKIAINNPTISTSWEVAKPQYFSWTGNCASMGAAATKVEVQLVQGPSTAVQFVAVIASIDCSGNITNIKNATIPAEVPAGDYSIRVMTMPENSYSVGFKVTNPAAPQPPTPTTAPPPPADQNSGAQKVAGSLILAAGSIAAALLL
ncbi:hypothetical protein BG004_006975 [Podila humilis]|nr:hypothetical protein BG004_006975 [Podila humilis]